MDIAALILSVISLCVAVYCIIQVEADRRSTHNIQYMPVDDIIKSAPEFTKDEAPKGTERKARKFLSVLPEDEIDV